MAKKKETRSMYWYVGLAFILISLAAFVFDRTFKAEPCANTKSCEESLNFSVDNTKNAVFAQRNIDPPDIDLSTLTEEASVLGTKASANEKHIDVDLTTQTLKAYEGGELFIEATVSTGKWFPTPTGEFHIWRKLRATLMAGGEGADYYYLPNVPFVMYFYNSQIAQGRGFALHGTYWHDNFGHAMSHGCVNMKTTDAQKLFAWADPPTTENQKSSKPGEIGTKIIIHGKAP
jgi:hypothetical protein